MNPSIQQAPATTATSASAVMASAPQTASPTRVFPYNVERHQLDLGREFGGGNLGQNRADQHSGDALHAWTPGASWPVRSTYST